MRRFAFVVAAFLAALVPSRLGAQLVGAEFRVSTYTTNNQGDPRVASDSLGNFVVIWDSYTQDGQQDGVFGQRYASSGARLGGEFRVNTYTSSVQRYPSVASDPSGDFVVVWRGAFQDGDSGGIVGQRYASSGTRLGVEFIVNTYTTNSQSRPGVAVDASGNFVVVWESFFQEGIFGQRYASSGARLGAEFQVNTYTTNIQERPQIASDSSGNFVVVWESAFQDGSLDSIFGQRFASSGARLGSEFRVNSYTSNDQRYPALASDGSGDFVVVWTSVPLGRVLVGQRYGSSGAPLGGEFRVNAGNLFNLTVSGAAFDSSGSFVVVWSSQLDGTSYGIFARKFASNGAPAATDFGVNTYTPGIQDKPHIATNGAGKFAVAWRSALQDGDQYGVFGQRICPVAVSVTVAGATTVCPGGTGGLASAVEDAGGAATHQWKWKPTAGMSFTSIPGATGATYQILANDFNGGALGSYHLVCESSSACGAVTLSNLVAVTVSNTDTIGPAVTPPGAATTAQTLCQ